MVRFDVFGRSNSRSPSGEALDLVKCKENLDGFGSSLGACLG